MKWSLKKSLKISVLMHCAFACAALVLLQHLLTVLAQLALAFLASKAAKRRSQFKAIFILAYFGCLFGSSLLTFPYGQAIKWLTTGDLQRYFLVCIIHVAGVFSGLLILAKTYCPGTFQASGLNGKSKSKGAAA